MDNPGEGFRSLRWAGRRGTPLTSLPASQFTRRNLLRISAAAGGSALVLSACSSAPKESAAGAKSPLGESLPPIEGGRVITDPARIPTQFREAPDFASMVQAGDLPEVAERIGSQPLVIEPVHSVGTYGGEIRRAYITVGDYQNGHLFCAGPDNLLYWDYEGKEVVPNIARDYELSDDDRVLTIHLREGMKWSDGEPFTADDIVFWRDEINLNPELSGGATALRMIEGDVEVRKIDDYTVEYQSPASNRLLPEQMASLTDVGGFSQWGSSGNGGFAPRHYLSQFLPEHTSQAHVDRLARDAGQPTWQANFLSKSNWTLNPDLPMVTPWVMTRPINDSPWTLEANPYSIWVDIEGNQLPYIPKIVMNDAGNQEVLNLKAVAGEYDFQDRGLQVSSLPVLLKNQEKSDYTIHRAPQLMVDFGIRVNLAYEKDRTIGDLLRQVEFRRALSLGIDRDEVNEIFFLGTCRPTAALCPETSPYFPGDEWTTKWATHDVDQANELLDGIGLTKRDSGGYRVRPDGRGRIRLPYTANESQADYPAMGEMVRRQWKEIGVDIIVDAVDSSLQGERTLANETVLTGIITGSDDVFIRPDTVLPTPNVAGSMGIPYGQWFATNGATGTEPPKELMLHDAFDLYRRGISASDAERIELGKEIYQMHADQVWSIGVVGFGLTGYGLYYAKNTMRNVPKRIVNSVLQKTPSNALPMTFYYED